MKLNRHDFDHALKFRPKGYNVKVWEFVVSSAMMDKSWARRVAGTDWVNNASNLSIQYMGECLYKSVIQLAKDQYDYLKHRAFGQSYVGALDPSARRRWEGITGRRVPTSQYWLYDHRDQTSAWLLKFNVKKGYGWVKKTKVELKKSKGA